MSSTKGISHLLTVDELAEVLGTGRRFVYRLTHERRIRFSRIGREVRFHPDDVAAYIESCTVEDDGPEPRRTKSSPARLGRQRQI